MRTQDPPTEGRAIGGRARTTVEDNRVTDLLRDYDRVVAELERLGIDVTKIR